MCSSFCPLTCAREQKRFAVLIRNASLKSQLRSDCRKQRICIRLSEPVSSGDVLKFYVEPSTEAWQQTSDPLVAHTYTVTDAVCVDRLTMDVDTRQKNSGDHFSVFTIKPCENNLSQCNGEELPVVEGVCIPAWCSCLQIGYSSRCRAFYLRKTGIDCDWDDCTLQSLAE